jgi:hypothetical protein
MFVNRPFQEHWIGQRGPMNWPDCSPDLTTANFYGQDFDLTDIDE